VKLSSVMVGSSTDWTVIITHLRTGKNKKGV
jgi:hypothetical protein